MTAEDIEPVKAALKERAEEFARYLYPAGRMEGHNWVVRDIEGNPGKSFKIGVSGTHTGLCKDFAGDGSHTLLDVYMALRGVPFDTAIEECADWLKIPFNGSRKNGQQKPAFDWEACKVALTTQQIAGFAQWRGFGVDHCRTLRDADILGAYEGHIALSVRDHHGSCIGAQYFPNGSRSLYVKGTPPLPLIIGTPKTAKRSVVFESPWDSFAYLEKCGRTNAEALVSTRGAGNAGRLAGVIPDSSEVIVFRQNDEPDETGKIADEAWFAKILETLARPVRSVRVPRHLKDLNDWTREGASAAEIAVGVANAKTEGELPGVPLMDLEAVYPDPAKTLLGNRMLCVGGGMVFVGPSGIGKSSSSAQQDILWGLGRPAFGIHPARPLRILTIQGENDDGDLGEIARGVTQGLALTDDDRAAVRARVIYVSENTRTGAAFLSYLETQLRSRKPDILRLDPLFAYLGGDVNDATVTAAFLRNGLNRLLIEYGCGAIINHHTPKVTNRDTSNWRASDWMYAGAGSADVTNWARAALVIDPTHATHVFKFIAAKRGSRAGWADEDGQTAIIRYFCHATYPAIFWRDATDNDIAQAEDAARAAKSGSGRAKTKEDVKALIPMTGSISKNALISQANTVTGIGLNKARGLIEQLIADESSGIHVWRIPRPHSNPETHLSRHEQTLLPTP